MPNAIPKASGLEDLLAFQIRALKLPVPERDVRWHPTRKWRADFLWREQLVAVEVEGGAWVGGRHVNAAGFEADMVKYNELVLAGYKLIRVSGRMVKDGIAVDYIKRALHD